MVTARGGVAPYGFEPIGFARSPYRERAEAPRQPSTDPAAQSARGRIELLPGRGYEDALADLGAWQHVWVIFVFHKNVEQRRGWKPKVQPPRSAHKRGVFATRSPHRPNPIGLSAVAIESVEGLTVHVRGLDLLDGTPVLDLKPYLPYADAHTASAAGWLKVQDPVASWEVRFADEARAQFAWLAQRGVAVRDAIERALSLGPEPHAYRRIRVGSRGRTLAVKEWRVDFDVEGRALVVRGVRSGHRATAIATAPDLELHRAFVAAFPPAADARS